MEKLVPQNLNNSENEQPIWKHKTLKQIHNITSWIHSSSHVYEFGRHRKSRVRQLLSIQSTTCQIKAKQTCFEDISRLRKGAFLVYFKKKKKKENLVSSPNPSAI